MMVIIVMAPFASVTVLDIDSRIGFDNNVEAKAMNPSSRMAKMPTRMRNTRGMIIRAGEYALRHDSLVKESSDMRRQL